MLSPRGPVPDGPRPFGKRARAREPGWVAGGVKGVYIDRLGKVKFRAHHADGRFSEGLARSGQGGKAGFIDRHGRLVISRSFDSAGAFSEGLAVVEIDRRFGYVDKDGTFAIRHNYLMASAFHNGVARVVEEGPCVYTGYGPCSSFNPINLPFDPRQKPILTLPRCRYSYIDRQGIRLFESRYPDAKDFAEELAPVGDGMLWGYVDRRGAVIISMKYEDGEPFAEGLARVRLGGKWGYIDRAGRLVIPAVYGLALDFSEGLAVVGDGDSKYWFIDKRGHQALPEFYTAASSFVMGRAHVRNGSDYYTARWSYIDHQGRTVFSYANQSSRKANDR